MKLLLTGATGFVGGHVRDAPLADGHELVCAVRRKIDSTNLRLRYITGDFAKDTDKSAWMARLGGIDVMLAVAGTTGADRLLHDRDRDQAAGVPAASLRDADHELTHAGRDLVIL